MSRPKKEVSEKTAEEAIKSSVSHAAQLASDKKYINFNLSAKNDIQWVCSTGSLSMDLFLGGGYRPGVFRLSGAFESGKTAFALNCGRLFQQTVPNAFVVYINAEGRITPERITQSGIDTSAEKFFRFDCNIADVVYQYMRDLIEKNDDNRVYMFIVDSTDALNRLGDMEKTFSEGEKVAGGALINSMMGRKITLPLHKYGHCLFMLGQVRVDLNTASSYSGPKDKPSGGKALGHYGSLVAEIKDKYVNDYIWENGDAKSAKERGKPIGHFVTFKFIKTRNDRTMEEVGFPIKRGRIDGKSIWIEYEFFMLAVQWGLIKVKGAWIAFSDEFAKEMTDNNIKFDLQMQGERKFIEYLEQNQEIVNFGCEKFKKLLIKDAFANT